MRNWVRTAFLLLPCIGVAACASNVAQNNLDTGRAAYDASFLTAAANYRSLGYCATGTVPTLAKPCADRKVVALLRSENATVIAAFNSWQAQVSAGNTAGAAAAYMALQTAVAAAESTANNLTPTH